MAVKGITPVISVILLLLVSIAIIGFAFSFFQRTVGTTAAEGESSAKSAVNMSSLAIRIDNAKNNAVAIRNTGSGKILLGTLSAYVNSSQAFSTVTTCTVSGAPATEISSGQIAVCALPCAANYPVRIVTSSSYEDRATCTA